MSREYFARGKGNILSGGFYRFLKNTPWTWTVIRRGRSLRTLAEGLHGPLKCGARFVYYWFRFPTGWPVSGHAYVEQADGTLRCEDCGAVSE